MRRREFIGGIAGTVAVWPLAARAAIVKPAIGFLSSRSREDTTNLVAAFRRGLAQYGYIEGQTISVMYRFARGQYDRLRQLAVELAREPIRVLAATGGSLSALAAKSATSAIPIVFTVGEDPVKLGLVASYAHPGSNITGVNILASDLETKQLGTLHALIPDASVIGILVDAKFPVTAVEIRKLEQAALSLGVQIHVARASTDEQIDAAYATLARQHISALMVLPSPFYDTPGSSSWVYRASTEFQPFTPSALSHKPADLPVMESP